MKKKIFTILATLTVGATFALSTNNISADDSNNDNQTTQVEEKQDNILLINNLKKDIKKTDKTNYKKHNKKYIYNKYKKILDKISSNKYLTNNEKSSLKKLTKSHYKKTLSKKAKYTKKHYVSANAKDTTGFNYYEANKKHHLSTNQIISILKRDRNHGNFVPKNFEQITISSDNGIGFVVNNSKGTAVYTTHGKIAMSTY